MKNKLKIYIPIYGVNIIFIYSKDFLKTGRKLCIEYQLDINTCHGLASRFKNKYLILIKKNRRNNLNTITHECLHVTNYILKDRGVIVDTDNDEAQAYLLGYIMEKIQSFKDKK